MNEEKREDIVPENPEDVIEEDLLEITDSVDLKAYLEKNVKGELRNVVLRITVPDSEKKLDKGVSLSQPIGADLTEFFAKKLSMPLAVETSHYIKLEKGIY